MSTRSAKEGAGRPGTVYSPKSSVCEKWLRARQENFVPDYNDGPKFAARAIAHFKETGEPLMEYQRKWYQIVLGTASSFTGCGAYALKDPTVES